MKCAIIKLFSLLSCFTLITACTTTALNEIGDDGTLVVSNYQNTHRVNAGDDIVGESFKVKVRKGDTLAKIGARYDVGTQEMKDANPHVNPKQLTVGDRLVIPTQYILPPKKYRNGIVINVAELRLYHFSPDGSTVTTYPVALGREGWRTPVGSTKIVRKEKDPVWNVPASIRKYTLEKTGERLPAVVPPGKDNPLGEYALYLGMSGYLIHGTNAPTSIGNLVSSGCIRMHNRDVEELYYQVDKGTPVHIIHNPNKAGIRNGQLYVESHTPIADQTGNYSRSSTSIHDSIAEATAGRNVQVSESVVRNVVNQHNGNPTVIGYDS